MLALVAADIIICLFFGNKLEEWAQKLPKVGRYIIFPLLIPHFFFSVLFEK